MYNILNVLIVDNDSCRQESNAEVTIEILRDNIDSLTKKISSHRCYSTPVIPFSSPASLSSMLYLSSSSSTSFMVKEATETENCNELKALLNLKDSQINQISRKLDAIILTSRRKDAELEEKNLHLAILQDELQDLQQEFLAVSQKEGREFIED